MSFFKHLINMKNNTNKETMNNLLNMREDYSIQDKVYEKLILYMEKKLQLFEEYQFGKWLKHWTYEAEGVYLFLYENFTEADFLEAQNSEDEILVQLREEIQFYDFIRKKELPDGVHTWEETVQKGYHLLVVELQEYVRQAVK